jgi:SAM-dependent methyltransferase
VTSPDRARRERLRGTFDSAAASYHQARPRYPAALFDSIDAFVGDGGALDVLEIGPATGIATIALAERGWSVTGLELGAELAAAARANTAHLAGVSIVQGSFDTWEPAEWGAHDLVAAATSWHWLDPATRLERAHRHLRPGGVLAFWSAMHVVPEGGDSFFAELQDVYDEIGESRGDEPWLRPGELPAGLDEIEASGLFLDVDVVHLDWEIVYDADSYIALLDTFSGHIALDREQRNHLDTEIRRRLTDRPDGLLRRHWGAALRLARRG